MDLRDKILHKADEICRKIGFRAMTLDEISSQLSISKKTIYQYFKDKDELVDAIIALDINKAMVDCTIACENSENALHEFILAVEMMINDMKDTNPIIVHDLQKFHPNTFAKLLKMQDEFYASIISNNLNRGIDEGLYSSDINVKVLTKIRMETIMLQFNQDIFPLAEYDFIQTTEVISFHFLYGILTDEGRNLIKKYKKHP